jgi:hypothetical protein
MKMRGLFLLLSVFFFCRQASAQTLRETIPLPNTTYWNQAYGLAPTPTSLYISSGTTTVVYNQGFIYEVDTLGNRIDSIATGLTNSQGLAWDGEFFWYIRGSGSTNRIFKITSGGAVVDSIIPPATNWFFGGACWDGTGLWVSLYSPNAIAALYKYDVGSKTIVDTIPTFGGQPQGIAWDGTYLFYAMDNNDGDVEKIYQVDPATKDTVLSWFLPEGPTSNMSPRGLAWDGRYLWLIAEPVGASSGRVLYKYDLTTAGTPAINVPVRFFDHGRIRVGNISQVTATIQSIGSADLIVDSVRVLLSEGYTTNLTLPVVIPPNGSQNFTITFTPTAYGVDSAHVILYHNDPARPAQVIRNVGMGIYPAAYLGAPASYDFGTRRVFSTNSWNMRIENQGATQLHIDSARFSSVNYFVEAGVFPMTIDSVAARNVRVWFHPTSVGGFSDTMTIFSNASNGTSMGVALAGAGQNIQAAIGIPLWTYTVPNHPISNTFRTVKAVRMISDLTGDDHPDIIISTENYWTMALNGNASVTNDSLWAFTTYISNSSAGSIGSTGSYSYQKALAIASDLDGDGFNDVVIGTGGGNERVYAISGKTGQQIWSFGTDHPDSFSLGDFDGVDASTDFNGDGVPDVIAASGATQSGGLGGRRSIYLFNGVNGNILWQMPLLGFTHAVAAIPDINSDGIPDVIGTVGEAAYKATAFSGSNGAVIWDFPLASTTGGGKEVIPFPVAGPTPDVIVGAFWGPVYRINGAAGTQVWSRATGGQSSGGVLQMKVLHDVTGDGIDEVVIALLGGGGWCLNGDNGNIVWSVPTGNTMGIAVIPDLNQDGFDEVAIAVQSQGAMILRGQDGQQLGLFSTSPNQAREVSFVQDMDGNNSFEIIMGGNVGNVALISGGLDAGPVAVGNGTELPTEFSVSQNYPNPFNPATTIEVNLGTQSDLTVRIFDVLGREVRTFSYERVPRGVHRVVWDGTSNTGASVSSGVYLCRVRAGERIAVRRMLLLK